MNLETYVINVYLTDGNEYQEVIEDITLDKAYEIAYQIAIEDYEDFYPNMASSFEDYDEYVSYRDSQLNYKVF